MNADLRTAATGRHNPPAKRAGGFTLLEVLVALAILAIALGALIKAGSANATNAAYLRDKTFAHWVALNTITEMQVRNTWPRPGDAKGEATMAEREWDWTAKVEDTPDATVRRVTVEVRHKDNEGQPLVRLVGFLQEPVRANVVTGTPQQPGNPQGSNANQQEAPLDTEGEDDEY